MTFNLQNFYTPSSSSGNGKSQGLSTCGSSSLNIKMITRVGATKTEVVSWWSSCDIKSIRTSTCRRFGQIKVVQIQSKLANLRIQRRYRVCTRSRGWICWWIRWVLNICTIIVQGWPTFIDQERAAYSKACRTITCKAKLYRIKLILIIESYQPSTVPPLEMHSVRA